MVEVRTGAAQFYSERAVVRAVGLAPCGQQCHDVAVTRRVLWIGAAAAVAASGAIIAAAVILTSGPSPSHATSVISGTPNPLLISVVPVSPKEAVPPPACFALGGADLTGVSAGPATVRVVIAPEAAARTRVTKVFLTVSARQISPAAYAACVKALPSAVSGTPAARTVVLPEQGVVPLPDLADGGSFLLDVRAPVRSVRAPVAYTWYVSAQATSIYGVIGPHSDTMMTLAPSRI